MLAVPGRKAGSYVNCPECRGRFWVPEVPSEDAAAATTPGASAPTPPPGAEAPPPPPAEPVATPPRPTQGHAPREASSPSAAGRPGGRKVARLITADHAESTLELAADGKLPQLQLHEADSAAQREDKSSSMSPLMLGLLMIASLICCVLLVLWEPSSGGSQEIKEQAREAIRQEYFFSPDGKLRPYQQWLRDAQRAASRGDRATERQSYLRVLDALRAERIENRPLTPNDKRLEQLIADILRE